MVRTAVRNGFSLMVGGAAALLSVGLASPVRAQTQATVITPLKVETDHNDVNVATGLARVPVPTLSTPAAPRLSFDTIQNAMPHLVAHISGGQGDYVTSSVAVHYGGAASESFTCRADDVCTSLKGNGSTIDGDVVNGTYYTFTLAPSGAIYTFDRLEYDNGPSQQNRQVQFYASSVAYPDGEVISYNYDTVPYYNRTLHRLSGISSNLGYYLTFSYQGNDGSQPNPWLTLAQATLYNASAPSTPLGQLTYGANGTITDMAGRTYSCSGCVNSVGARVELPAATVTLPGESAAAEVVTPFNPNPNNALTPQLVSSVARDGVSWSYNYVNIRTAWDSSGRPTEGYTYDKVVVSGPGGFSQTYTMIPRGKYTPNLIGSVIDSLGRTTSYGYDVSYRPTAVSYPEGNLVQITYDQYGNITSKVSRPKPGSSLATVTETSAIDANACAQEQVMCYRPTTYTDGLGRTTQYAYDSAGRLIQETAPADDAGVRRVKYLTYGSSFTAPTVVRICGLGATCGTAAEIRTEYTYLGQTALPLTETRIDGTTGTSLTISYSYDAAGRVLVMDGPLPGADDAVYFRYDVLGRKTWEIGAKGANGTRVAKRYTYRDSDDKLIATETGSVTDPQSAGLNVANRTDVAYDGHRNPTREAFSASGTTYSVLDRAFDDRGRLVCQTQRMNHDAFGSLPDACSLGPQGGFGPDRITRNLYDAAGQLLTVQKAYGTPLQQDYATYTYTANGKQASVRDANGNLAGLTYDGFDRLVEWHFPSPTATGQVSPTDYEAYGYDAVGNRTLLRKRDGVQLTYQYDALNRMTVKNVPGSMSGAAGYNVYYGYDVRGLQTYARFGSASGPGVTNAYDGFGQLTASTTTMGGVSRTVSTQYDAGGGRSRVTHPDGVYFAMTYDGAGRMVHSDWWGPASGAVPFMQITYDELGRRREINRASSYTGYFYDAAGDFSTNQRFQGAGSYSELLGYTPVHQIFSRVRDNDDYAFPYVNANRSYAVNGLNQYTSAGATGFSYDANGNLTASGSTSYVYDAENRLVSASASGGTTLTYDPLGRLWQTASPVNGKTQFVYDGDHVAVEYDGDTGGIRRRYMWGPGADEPILWDESSDMNCSGTRFLHTDHQGSIIAIADCWGSRIAVNTYDEYGIPGTNNQGRFQYTGQAWLPDLGMYYYKARIYSPTLGRFMQTDPIGYQDQINLYAYVANDPVNRTDPTGDYQEGTGFTDKEWARFNKAQQQEAKSLDSRAGKLESQAAKMNAKEAGSGALKQAAAANLRADAATLRDTSSTAPKANLLTQADYAKLGRPAGSQAVTIGRDSYFSRGPLGVFGSQGLGTKWTIGHEGFHTFGLRDQLGPNGALAYKGADQVNTDALNAIRGTLKATINPDSLLNGDN